jgi:tape measure domain-containing protein
MANIVEFALRFKDMASSELGRFGAQAQRTFNNAAGMANNLTGHNRVLGQSYDALQNQIRTVENTIRNSTIPSQIREARRELERLQRQSSSHAGNINGGGSSATGGGMLNGMMGAVGLSRLIGPAAIAGAGFMAAKGIGESISLGLERQQIRTSFNVLSGSEQAGGELTNQLVDLQKNTILGAEVFKNAQTMMGFGFKNTEVLDNMKMLGDVSMGNADKLGNLTLAFSQTRAAGKLTGQDLLQYINAGFNPLEEISKRTGRTIGELKKDMETGGVSFAMVQQAFKDATGEGGKFNNMLETIAQTPAGKMAQFSGMWQEFKIKAGTAFMPLVSMVLDLGSKLLPIIESLLIPLTNGIEKMVTWIKAASTETGGWMVHVGTIKDYIVNSLWPFIQKIAMAVWNIVSKLFEFIKNSQLIQDIFKYVYWVLGKALNIVGGLIDGLVWVFNNVVMPILNAVEKVYRWIKGSNGVPIKVSPVDKPTGKNPAPKSNTELLSDTAGAAAGNATTAAGTGSSMSNGGPKTITITIQKVLDNINIHATTLENGLDEVESKVTETLSRILGQSVSQAL